MLRIQPIHLSRTKIRSAHKIGPESATGRVPATAPLVQDYARLIELD